MRIIKKILPYVKMFLKRADMFLFVMCLICSLYGLAMVHQTLPDMYAAHWVQSTPTRMMMVQVFSMLLGIAAFVLLTVIDADLLANQWKLLCALNLALLVVLYIFGQDDGTGNKSWIRFAGIGIQPSEVIKVIYIIVAAKQMAYLKEYKDINSFLSVAQMAAHAVIVFGAIVVVSADLGSAAIILGILVVMLFALGLKLYWFAAGGAAVAAMIPLLWTYFLKDYQKQRLIAPYAPDVVDPSGDGITWQTKQSMKTLASGRLTGVDADYTVTTFTGKHTDFIFSSTGEILGMVGCIAIMILLTIVIVHCVRVGLHAGRTFDMLLCIGVAASMACQTFINIGMCIGITPVIGITLPFFSYGGSSMMTTFAAMGLVSGVKYNPKPQLISMF